MKDNNPASTPSLTAEYEPDETYMQALFARHPAPPEPKEPFGYGHSFNGISGEEADDLRWAALRGEPAR